MKKTLGLILLLTMTTSGYGYDRITGEKFASRSEVIGQHGMVATSHPLGDTNRFGYSQKGRHCN